MTRKKMLKKNKNICLYSMLKALDYSCQGSSWHGLKYLSISEKLPLFHQCIWIVKITMATILSIWMANIFYIQCTETYTITKIDSSTFPVGEMYFPCITVCNINKVSKNNFKPIMNILLNHGISEKEINNFAISLATLTSFSTFDYADRNISNHTKIFDVLKTHNYSLEKVMDEVQQKCDEMLEFCMFQGEPIKCSEEFVKIKSMEGFCCSFNYRGPENYRYTEPEYVSVSGTLGGMTLVLNINSDDYLAPSKPHFGAIVLISNPTDFPEISAKSITVESNTSAEIRVEPSKIISSEAVRRVPLYYRRCKFSDEIISKTTSDYSFQMCMLECKIKAILKLCGCIPYYYPNPEIKPQCYLNDLECLKKNKGILNSLIYPKDEIFINTISCDCMPDCSDTSYTVKTFQENINKSAFVNNAMGLSFINKSIVSIIYPKNTCTVYEKDIFLYWNDVFATYGGIFSLCIGGSILSIIETFYKFLKAFICFNKRYVKKQKALQPFYN